MKITPYGIISTIAIFIGLSFVNNVNVVDVLKIILIIFISLLSQIKLCDTCSTVYSFASHLTIIPLLTVLLFNCKKVYMMIFVFALICAIGRIGCYFAGCCTGKEANKNDILSICYNVKDNKDKKSKKDEETMLGFSYNNDYIVNKNIKKKKICVQPTIFLEIFLQFVIVIILVLSKYGLYFYGIMNIILLITTNFWRLEKRMSNNYFLPILSLVIFCIIVFVKKCNLKTQLKFVVRPILLLIAVSIGLIVSNDINVGNVKNMIKLKLTNI